LTADGAFARDHFSLADREPYAGFSVPFRVAISSSVG
jgi:hypothetical protein